mmetsp:Transcript_32868/g.90785  ORF Transcript_32868/g.90785 Transcript_32868/m.90785 type:complete len:567 (-) Transcript_32868:72-1772(-)
MAPFLVSDDQDAALACTRPSAGDTDLEVLEEVPSDEAVLPAQGCSRCRTARLAGGGLAVAALALLSAGSGRWLLGARAGAASVAQEATLVLDHSGHSKQSKLCGMVSCGWTRIIPCKKTVDDGTVGYRCCCSSNSSRFVSTSQWFGKTGPIRVGTSPFKCFAIKRVDTDYDGDAKILMENQLGLLGHPLEIQACKAGHRLMTFDMTMGFPGMARVLRLAAHPGMCLEVGGAGQNGDGLKLGVCGTGPQDTFYMPGGPLHFGRIVWARNPKKCLDISGGHTKPDAGRRIVLEDCDTENPNQLFRMPQSPAEENTRVSPSFFCISLMMPRTGEEVLLKSQLALGPVGIFGCNQWAVYSNESRLLNDGPPAIYTDVMPGNLSCEIGGKWHSALNTQIFIRFWEKVIRDPRAWSNEWILKADPDTVFFPERLQELLGNMWPGGHADDATWLNNCDQGNHGPITVINKYALGAYKDTRQLCVVANFSMKRPQEDLWFRECLEDVAGVKRKDAYNLLYETDWACDESPLLDCHARQVAFHPYKRVAAWQECWANASQMHWKDPLYPSTKWGT